MYYEWSGQNLNSSFDYACSQFADRHAVTAGDVRQTYAELQQSVFELAEGLRRRHGVRRGTRVACILDNSLQFAHTMLALWRLGAVAIPLNLTWTGREFVQAFELTDAEVLITVDGFRDTDYLGQLAEALPELADHDADDPGADRLLRDSLALRTVIVAARRGRVPEYAYDFADVVSAGAAAEVPAMLQIGADLDPQDPALCLPTSGSTGFPKPVIHTHSSFLAMCSDYADAVEFGPQDTILNYGTTYHVSGQLLMYMPLLRGGAQTLLDWFAPDVALELIERDRVTVTWGFSVHYLMMRRHPSFDSVDIGSLRSAMMGSDPTTYAEIAEMGIPHHGNIYGSSEYLSNFLPWRERHDRERTAKSHGRPMNGVQQRIVDPETGEELKPGDIGEICIKGPGLFRGYYNMPDETEACFDNDGFFHSGDLGTMDDDGYTYFRGRLKDTVKTGGENVSAREVELFLQGETPWIEQVQVVAVPDPKWGEAVTALVELKPGAEVDAEGIRAFCKGKLAGYKIPKRVLFVGADDWIVTPTGKVDKKALQQWAIEELGLPAGG